MFIMNHIFKSTLYFWRNRLFQSQSVTYRSPLTDISKFSLSKLSLNVAHNGRHFPYVRHAWITGNGCRASNKCFIVLS